MLNKNEPAVSLPLPLSFSLSLFSPVAFTLSPQSFLSALRLFLVHPQLSVFIQQIRQAAAAAAAAVASTVGTAANL